IPNRTLSPRISTTVMMISSPIMILSSRCRDRTSIVFGSFLLPARPATVPDHAARALGDHDGAGGGTSTGRLVLLRSSVLRRGSQRRQPWQHGCCRGGCTRFEWKPQRVPAGREYQLPAQAADRVEDQRSLEVDRQPPAVTTVQNHVDQCGTL